MEVLEALAAQACHLEDPLMQKQQEELEDRASHVS